MRRIQWLCALTLAFITTGCCKNNTDDPPPPVADPPVANTSVPTTEKTVGNLGTSTPTGTTTDPNRPGRGLDGLPAEIPSPSSKPPTTAEWNAVPWEITVSRSTPLGCETKMVREWLRVSCRDENKYGGKIRSVTIVQKGGVQAYKLERDGLASLVVQVVKGKKHVSRFRWADRTQRLVVDWSDLGPRPSIKFVD